MAQHPRNLAVALIGPQQPNLFLPRGGGVPVGLARAILAKYLEAEGVSRHGARLAAGVISRVKLDPGMLSVPVVVMDRLDACLTVEMDPRERAVVLERVWRTLHEAREAWSK
jgi:hypothetical protein